MRGWGLVVGSAIATGTLPAGAVGQYACPTELAPLTQLLLRDLPAYLNRQQVRQFRQRDSQRYAIVASQPNLQPLPTGSEEYPDPAREALQQVFFTVLERQYSQNRVSEQQAFHWLFLAATPTGWRLALLYSRFSTYPIRVDAPITPPAESSQSLTAQAIRRWLRDCQAGVVRPG